MARQQKPRKSGRPALTPEKKKLPPVGFRPTPGLKAILDQAAEVNGRSLSKEIESRLERSVQSDEAMGGGRLYALFRMMGAAANLVEAGMGKEWSEDIDTYLAVKEAWLPLIEDASPPITQWWMDNLEAVEHDPPLEPSQLSSLSEKDEKARAAYESQMRKFRREMKAFQRPLKGVHDRLEKITGVGRGVAAELLKPEGKK